MDLQERSLSGTLRPHRWCCQGTGQCSQCSAQPGVLWGLSGGRSHSWPSSQPQREGGVQDATYWPPAVRLAMPELTQVPVGKYL